MRYLVERMRGSGGIKRSYLYSLDDTIAFYIRSAGGYSGLTQRQEQAGLYKNLLNSQYRAEIGSIRHALRRSGEYYEERFETGIGSDYYYLVWSVKRLQFLIKKAGLRPVARAVKPMLPLVNLRGITKKGLAAARHNPSPIILAEIPFTGAGLTILDGNHRLISRGERGDVTVDCFVLPPELHKRAMMGELFRYLFNFNTNINSALHPGQYAGQ